MFLGRGMEEFGKQRSVGLFRIWTRADLFIYFFSNSEISQMLKISVSIYTGCVCGRELLLHFLTLFFVLFQIDDF